MLDDRQETSDSNAPRCLPVIAPHQQAARWRRLVRLRNTIIAIWLGGLACNITVPMILVELFPGMKSYALGLMGAFCFCWVSACVAGIALEGELDDQFKKALKSNDVSSLSCWIDALFSPVSKWAYPQSASRHYEAARAGLIEHLPLLTEDSVLQLRSSERQMLYRTLQGKDMELIRAVLSAIPVLGDARALPFVRHLADGKGMAASDLELQTEAQSTLIRLQAHLDLSSGARGLLRASHQPSAPEAELLLPAQANTESQAAELLRADTQE